MVPVWASRVVSWLVNDRREPVKTQPRSAIRVPVEFHQPTAFHLLWWDPPFRNVCRRVFGRGTVRHHMRRTGSCDVNIMGATEQRQLYRMRRKHACRMLRGTIPT